MQIRFDHGPDGGAARFRGAARLIAALDTDGDGMLSAEEYARMDADGDGTRAQ